MRILALFLFASFLVACVTDKTASNTNLLNIGMTKAAVIGTMGQPTATRAIQNTEILTYVWEPCKGRTIAMGTADILSGRCLPVEFLVRLSDGRLDAYGKAGDFNLSKNPAADLNVTVK